MQSKRWDSDIAELYKAITLLKTEQECRAFMTDLCTVAELQSISQRLAVARMLREKVTYHEIGKATGASAATISRVNRALQYGSEGYQLILDRLAAFDAEQQEEDTWES